MQPEGAGVTKAGEALRIVQVVRRMEVGGGVGGVACALQAAFDAAGVAAPPITARGTLRPGRSRTAEIVGFTLAASLRARRARRDGSVVLVHGDALGGDIYVDHGLHKALVGRRPWLLLHPLHLFILVREEVRHALGRAGVNVCLSAAGGATLRGAYPLARRTPVQPIANGVDLARFRPDPDHLARRTHPGEAELAFVGHEFSRKGLAHLLDAMAELPAGVRLQVVGGRPREQARARAQAMRLGVADRVAFHGVRGDVEAVLARVHLLVLPSVQEACPLVALEAMACGAGVMLAGVPAAPELIGARGEAGRVVAACGPSVAAAVRALVADPDALSAMRHAAVERAQAFGWPAVAERYLALARGALAERTRGGPCGC